MWWVQILPYVLHPHYSLPSTRGAGAAAPGQTTKVVHCEACRRSYAYELKRTGYGSDPDESAYSVALQRAEADLQRLLATGVEAIPCPACGWYQSSMIPLAQTQHCRWMLNAGLCLTIGLIPVAVIPASINATYADQYTTPIPWPIFAAGAAGLAGLLAVGIGLLWKYHQRHRYDPNREDVEARIRYGQSRATILSKEEARKES
jgi:hypothetical protein